MNEIVTIGVFDSGLGGLWVLRHLQQEIPNAHYVYFADQAYIPYGAKSVEQIIERACAITDFLLQKGCTMIVVACNTATSAAIVALRERYPLVVFVGMEPAVKPACLHSQTGHIGVLATRVTATGKKLQDAIDAFASSVEVHTVIGDGLVELVEEKKSHSQEAHVLLQTYLEPLLAQHIDQLVLGCTHYAFLIPQIRNILGDTVTIVDPTPAVVARVASLLPSLHMPVQEIQKSPEFFTSGDSLEELISFYSHIYL